MRIQTFVFNPFFENTYIVTDDTREAVIIDPGCYEDYEKQELVSYIGENKLKPVAIWNTHCHIDHVLGNAYCARHFNIPLLVPEGEKPVLDSVPAYSSNYGFQQYEIAEVNEWIPNKGILSFGTTQLDILYAPGHSLGHLMFLERKTNQLIAGDVIFRESIGRTDLPGGDYATLERSIREQVYTLQEDVVIYPGHGPTTTVGHEAIHNPFVRK
ncbi:MAG: MBL fold metallo-hydrolase [Cyclobacteriaceae bacterium]|jgi:hydroxyacylglutathione hydrolase